MGQPGMNYTKMKKIITLLFLGIVLASGVFATTILTKTIDFKTDTVEGLEKVIDISNLSLTPCEKVNGNNYCSSLLLSGEKILHKIDIELQKCQIIKNKGTVFENEECIEYKDLDKDDLEDKLIDEAEKYLEELYSEHEDALNYLTDEIKIEIK